MLTAHEEYQKRINTLETLLADIKADWHPYLRPIQAHTNDAVRWARSQAHVLQYERVQDGVGMESIAGEELPWCEGLLVETRRDARFWLCLEGLMHTLSCQTARVLIAVAKVMYFMCNNNNTAIIERSSIFIHFALRPWFSSLSQCKGFTLTSEDSSELVFGSAGNFCIPLLLSVHFSLIPVACREIEEEEEDTPGALLRATTTALALPVSNFDDEISVDTNLLAASQTAPKASSRTTATRRVRKLALHDVHTLVTTTNNAKERAREPQSPNALHNTSIQDPTR
ncbi:hypothetical protein SVAN01_00328 [Stagonosporopsis vannaccii]|nr:hypothetical protein SVAN01_00328 [Stagonosporopsis vannaccii]